MRPGKLNKRITIQYKVITRDSYGEETVTWTKEDIVWAAIEPIGIGVREYFEAQQTQAKVTHRITMRYRAGLTPDKRILYGNHTYEIESAINPNMANKELIVMCREDVK